MTCVRAHPDQGKEVTVMDDVDVTIRDESVSGVSDLKERMGKE